MLVFAMQETFQLSWKVLSRIFFFFFLLSDILKVMIFIVVSWVITSCPDPALRARNLTVISLAEFL